VLSFRRNKHVISTSANTFGFSQQFTDLTNAKEEFVANGVFRFPGHSLKLAIVK